MSSSEIPNGNAMDNDYKSRTGQNEIPVQNDEAPVEATEYTNGGDSDAQLGMYLSIYQCLRHQSNIMQNVTRRTPSTRATSSMSAHVVLPRSLALTPSPVMRRVLVPLPMALTVPLLPDRGDTLYKKEEEVNSVSSSI